MTDSEYRRILREAEDLNITQRFVLSYYMRLGQGGVPVRLTTAAIAADLGTTPTVAGRARKVLVELGYLEPADRIVNVTYYRLGPRAGGNVVHLRRA